MKAVIAAAVAAAFALPVVAQQSTPTPSDRAQNREQVQEKLPSAQERAENREKVQDKLPTADERAKNRRDVSTTAASAALTTKVKAALAKEEGMRSLGKINVDSADGVVTLKGKVESAEAKKKAGEVAKQVDGVKSVKNQLTVEKKG